MAGITAGDGLLQRFLELLVISVLDGFLKRLVAQTHHPHHQLALLFVDSRRERGDSLQLLQLVRRHRPVARLAGAVHDVKPFRDVRHEAREGLLRFQRLDARLKGLDLALELLNPGAVTIRRCRRCDKDGRENGDYQF